MKSPAATLKNFIDTYAGRKEILPMLRRIYITCIESNMTDDWHGQQRIDFFYLIEDLEQLLPCLDLLQQELRPVLKELEQKFKEKNNKRKWHSK